MKLDPKYNKRPEDTNFRDAIKTPLHEAAMAYYLREAWKEMHGEYPSQKTLSIAWSQTVLEAGRDTDKYSNSMMRNYNYGNIKKNLDYSPLWTSYTAGEFIKGKHVLFEPYHPETHFAAWETPLAGALGYLTFLKNRKRYAAAWKELEKGNVVNYVKELKAGGYFTAPLNKYTEVVVRLTKEFNKKYDKFLSFEPPAPPPEPEPEPELEEEPEIDVEWEPEEPEKSDDTESNSELEKAPEESVEQVSKFLAMLLLVWNFLLQMIKKAKP